MILSPEQIKAIQGGAAVAVTLDDTNCVILRKDLYDKVKDLVYDDSEMDPRDAYPAVLTAWDQDDIPGDYESYK